jgi:DNA-binding LacI/PurR family transcriptional regulator
VSVGYEHMARTAVRAIIDNSRRAEITPVRIVLPVRLLVRESTRPRASEACATSNPEKEGQP